MKNRLVQLFSAVLLCIAVFAGCSAENIRTAYNNNPQLTTENSTSEQISQNEIPEYNGSPSVEIGSNIPDFNERDKNTSSFATYSELDSLGRCKTAFANIGIDLMPTEKRGNIGQVKPSGWHTVKYDNVDGNYLYNRCHLIAYELTGENANPKNLITGTRYLNIKGMLPYENKVADYIKRTKNHVLYRVTPVFKDSNLIAEGVVMEGYSVEDKGKGISFHVYVYNVQPGIGIDYSNGESKLLQSASK